MGSTQSKVTAQDKAILDLKLQRDKLHQYQRRVSVLAARETSAARSLLARGDRPRALLALRRKKYQESLLSRTDSQLEQLERLVSSVEFALIQKDVVFGLQQGTAVLTEIRAEMGGLEHVEKLMGENADAVAYQKEVSEMLGGRISVAEEEDVEDELAALEAEEVAKKQKDNNKKMPSSSLLPPPPVTADLPPEEEAAQESNNNNNNNNRKQEEKTPPPQTAAVAETASSEPQPQLQEKEEEEDDDEVERQPKERQAIPA